MYSPTRSLSPTNAPVGARNVKVTVTSTEPLVGSGGATFTVVARPPTNAIIVTQLTPVSAYEYTEASFHFATTNDAPNDAPFPMTYAWYKNSVLVSTNAMGPYYTFLTTPADNGTQIYAIARVADTNFSSLAVTSAVVTLTVNSWHPCLYQWPQAGILRRCHPRQTLKSETSVPASSAWLQMPIRQAASETTTPADTAAISFRRPLMVMSSSWHPTMTATCS